MKRFLFLLAILAFTNPILTQRNLLVFKQDLEFRLASYVNQRRVIDDILSSSITPQRREIFEGPSRISHTGGKIQFADLIISNGSLVLGGHIARPTVRMLVNKTNNYVSAKMNELYQVKTQLNSVKHQIDSHKYIYKGLRGAPMLPNDNRNVIPGTRLFKQFLYSRGIQAGRIQIAAINHTNVDHVINETYMANAKVGLLDPQSRLFFEGKKTFWHAKFSGDLRSGCCDRLKPIHTDRMMRRTRPQDIYAPVMFHTNNPYSKHPIVIHNLTASQLYNRILAVGLISNRPDDNGLIPSPIENLINLESLIHIKIPSNPRIPKTVIFSGVTQIDRAQLYSPVNDQALVIGLASKPGYVYDLNHHNYLLRFRQNWNESVGQFVAGSTVVNGGSHFIEQIVANIVNGLPRFDLFVRDNLVRIDKPTVIRGPVQFSALPMFFTPPAGLSEPPRNVAIMMANKELQVGLINGMRIPEDLVYYGNSPLAYKPGQVIRVRGPREFVNQVGMQHLHVYKTVNGLMMPQEVIPLHLNDFMGSTGLSNILFLDGISTQHLTVHSGYFDSIEIRDSDAQNIIMRSVFTPQLDGSYLVRAPLEIINLRLLGRTAETGLLNNFRPQTLVQLAARNMDGPLYGRKYFMNTVEADDCIFSDVNDIENWTNHLIRIDRPNLIQNVHTRLSFEHAIPAFNQMSSSQQVVIPSGSVNVARLRIDFYPDDSVYQPDNWNLSPEFYMMHQALIRTITNNTAGRYRVLDQIRLLDMANNPTGRVNAISLDDIVTLDKPFRFNEGYVLVGKVSIKSNLRAARISSNYPLDVMDLMQFNQFRVPIMGSPAPVKLNSLVLGQNNRANFIQLNMLNGISFNEFVASIMSLTKPQIVDSSLTFNMPVKFESFIRTGSSLNNIKNFKQFINYLRTARYSFEDGVQCNSVTIFNKRY